MLAKSPRNDFKIKSRTNSRIKRSLISRFKKRWIQVPREEIKKTSQGKYWKDFSKNKYSTVLFFKRVFTKFSKLPKFLLSGNRLPVSCNRLSVAKFDFKSFQLNLQCSNWFQNGVIDYKILVIDYQCVWTLKFKFNCEESHPFSKMLCVIDYNDLVIDYQ